MKAVRLNPELPPKLGASAPAALTDCFGARPLAPMGRNSRFDATPGVGQKQPNGIKAKVSRKRSFAEGL